MTFYGVRHTSSHTTHTLFNTLHTNVWCVIEVCQVWIKVMKIPLKVCEVLNKVWVVCELVCRTP